MKSVFITATDTNMGKTTVACHLLKKWGNNGEKTGAIKPVASGCIKTLAGLRSQDALDLASAANTFFPYENINPFAFEPAIAPHIAAKKSGVHITVENLLEKTATIRSASLDKLIIEGAGGWYVPINEKETLADFVKSLDIPVILVVGIRVGCINHALLTAEAIINNGVSIAGWIANQIESEVFEFEEIISTLAGKFSTRPLETLRYNETKLSCCS